MTRQLVLFHDRLALARDEYISRERSAVYRARHTTRLCMHAGGGAGDRPGTNVN